MGRNKNKIRVRTYIVFITYECNIFSLYYSDNFVKIKKKIRRIIFTQCETHERNIFYFRIMYVSSKHNIIISNE